MRANTLTLQTTAEFFIEECCECGVLFGIPIELQRARIRDKRTFWCPNGHDQHYLGKTDAQLRKEAEQRAASAEEEARIAHAETKRVKAEAERLRKRAAAGVCPCCNRSFVQLARHMKTKHPDYAT